jgi:pimeloyl-ACP methyl ester carboxylesterase
MTFARKLAVALAVPIVVAAIGFWLRPVSYFAESVYLREFLSGIRSHSVRVSGYRVHYLEAGPANGAPVVLVHGLGGSAEDWLRLEPFLVKAGFRVYIPDLPGYGRSGQPTNFSYSVPDEAAVVVRFLDAIGLKQVNLGGWSMGGWIVQILASDHPERIRRLMLFDSAGVYIKLDWNTGLFTPATPAELDQLEALLSPHPRRIPGFVARDVLRISRERAWIIQRAMNSMLTGSYVTDALLPRLKMPVLIEWGALDRITPVASAARIHSLAPQSELNVVPGCGHLAPTQCASQMGPQVEAFLQK